MEVSYPIHMYKDLHAPAYANDKKEVEKLEAEGWTSVWANIGPQEYPRHLYRDDGDMVLVGNYEEGNKGVLVVDLEAAQAEEARYKEEGYSRTPVAANSTPETPVKGIMEAIVDVKENANRLTALEGDVADIKSGMAKILAVLNGTPKDSKPGNRGRRYVESVVGEGEAEE